MPASRNARIVTVVGTFVQRCARTCLLGVFLFAASAQAPLGDRKQSQPMCGTHESKPTHARMYACDAQSREERMTINNHASINYKLEHVHASECMQSFSMNDTLCHARCNNCTPVDLNLVAPVKINHQATVHANNVG